jgi:DNA-binding transcriptional LysR family regulator
MDLEELRVLVAVAETGSLLGAAEKLGITRSTLRRRIDDLEARTHVPLLVRSPQGAALTEAGQHLAQRGRGLLSDASALLRAVRELGAGPAGLVRVSLPTGLPPKALAALYQALRATHPQLLIQAQFSDDPLARLNEGADVAFVLGPQLPEGPYLTRVVRRFREWVVASPAYIDAHPPITRPEDLLGHKLLAWRCPGLDPRSWPCLQGPPIEVEPLLITNEVHLLRQLALAGEGLALVPDAMLPDPDEGPLVPVLPDWIGRDCIFRMVVPEPLARSPRVAALLQELLNWLDEP